MLLHSYYGFVLKYEISFNLFVFSLCPSSAVIIKCFTWIRYNISYMSFHFYSHLGCCLPHNISAIKSSGFLHVSVVIFSNLPGILNWNLYSIHRYWLFWFHFPSIEAISYQLILSSLFWLFFCHLSVSCTKPKYDVSVWSSTLVKSIG